jgi:hypothetical protein
MHLGHSVEQSGTICSFSEHETSRALGDTVIRILLPQVGGAHAAAFRDAGVLPRLDVLQLRDACARQLRPADRWPSFHRARRQRSSASAVRGPVKEPPCMRQRVYFPVNF